MRSRLTTVNRRSLNPAKSVSPNPTVPEVGRSSPAATFKNVLLPEPDGPIKAVNDPAASATLTPSSATTAPSPRPYTFRTARKATTGAEAAVLGERRVDLNMTFLLAGRVALHRAASRDVSADCLSLPYELLRERHPARRAGIRLSCHVANLRSDRAIGIVGRLDSGSSHPTIRAPT